MKALADLMWHCICLNNSFLKEHKIYQPENDYVLYKGRLPCFGVQCAGVNIRFTSAHLYWQCHVSLLNDLKVEFLNGRMEFKKSSCTSGVHGYIMNYFHYFTERFYCFRRPFLPITPEYCTMETALSCICHRFAMELSTAVY